MDREYYEQYRQIELDHWWFQGRELILKHLLRHFLLSRRSGDRLKILNVGCATGRSSEWLREFGEVDSVEYDAECAGMAREFTGMNIQVGTAEALVQADDSYDIVTAFDVLEHIENDSKAAAELMRVCAPGGLVFITVPAFKELWSEHDDVNHHYRRYRRNEVRRLFETRSKGQILKDGYFNFWLFPAIACIRLGQLVMKKTAIGKGRKAVSDFQRVPSGLFCSVFRWLFATERGVLTHGGLEFPFGVSAYLAWRAEARDPSSSTRPGS